MSYSIGNKKSYSMFQGIGQKVKFAAELAGAVKTGFAVARGAYSAFQAVSPYLATALLLP